MREIYLPQAIRDFVAGESYSLDGIGMSDSKVLIFADKVLKIQPDAQLSRSEHAVMTWLDGRLPAPRPLCYVVENGMSYLLMSRVRGSMACDEAYMREPARLASILADSLKRLWQVDISDCPVKWDLQRKLADARLAVERGEVDVENVEPDTFGENGFRDPEHLLCWLEENRPEEEFVLSHGDFCLPNVMLENGHLAGYIDLGRMGASDRWQDIALCYRSLKNNYGGKYTGKVYPGYNPDCLFDALGMQPDWEKIRYYILLDELF